MLQTQTNKENLDAQNEQSEAKKGSKKDQTELTRNLSKRGIQAVERDIVTSQPKDDTQKVLDNFSAGLKESSEFFKPVTNRLEAIIMTTLGPKILEICKENKIDPSNLKNFAELDFDKIKGKFSGIAEVGAVKAIQEGIKNGNSELSGKLNEIWGRYLAQAKDLKSATEAAVKIAKGEKPTEESGIYETIKNLMADHPIAFVIMGLSGGYLVYRVVDSIVEAAKEKVAGEAKNGLTDEVINKLKDVKVLTALLAVFISGGIVGKDAFSKFVSSNFPSLDIGEIIKKIKEKGPIDSILSFLAPAGAAAAGVGAVTALTRGKSGEALSEATSSPKTFALPEKPEFEPYQKILNERYIPDSEAQKAISVAEKYQIPWERAAGFLADRKVLAANLETKIAQNQNPTPDELNALIHKNEELGEELKNIKKESLKTLGWSEEKYLLMVPGTLLLMRYLTLPSIYSSYGIYVISSTIQGAAETAKNLHKMRTGEVQIDDLFEARESGKFNKGKFDDALKKIDQEIEGIKNNATNTAKGSVVDTNEQALKQELDTRTVSKLEAEKNVYKKVLEIEDKKALIQERIKSGHLEDADDVIKSLKNEINQAEHELMELRKTFLFAKTDLGHSEINVRKYNKFDRLNPNKPNFLAEHFEEMDNLTKHVRQMRADLDFEFKRLLDLADKANDIPTKEKYIKAATEIGAKRAAIDTEAVKDASKYSKSFWKILKEQTGAAKYEIGNASTISKARNLYQELLGAEIANSNVEKSLLSKVTNTFKGNVVVYGIAIGLGSYLNYESAREKDIVASTKQAAADTLPVADIASNFYTAYTGEEYFTNHQVDTTGRALRAVLGSASVLTLAGTRLGGAGKWILNAGEGVIEEGLGQHYAKKIAGNAATLEERKAALDNMTKLQNAVAKMQSAGNFLRIGALAGGLGAAGYQMFLKPIEVVPISPELQALMGSQLHETGLLPPKI